MRTARGPRRKTRVGYPRRPATSADRQRRDELAPRTAGIRQSASPTTADRGLAQQRFLAREMLVEGPWIFSSLDR